MSWMAQIFRLDVEDRKKLVVCASLRLFCCLRDPISGAVFGVEVLYIGQMLYDVLLPSFISGIIARIVASSFGVPSLAGAIVSISLDWKYVILSIFAGVFFGLVSIMHIEMLNYVEDKFGTLIFLVEKANLRRFYPFGNSIDFRYQISWTWNEHGLWRFVRRAGPLLAFVIKSFAMAITLSCGGSGGVLTPTFFVGQLQGQLWPAYLVPIRRCLAQLV